MKLKSIHITIILLAAISIPGCMVYDPIADFTHQRYTNAVSYFNTFYNAQRLFDDGENEVIKAKREFMERGSFGRVFTAPASARTKFQASIEKNSKVLSFYPDSKWVDDALLMIGKAYFYMDDDLRAERKFLELSIQFPQSDLLPESQLWLGKTLLRQKKYTSGIKQFEEIISKGADIDDDITGEASYELAQYYFSINEFSSAIKYYSISVDLVNNDELQTQIYFQIGKSHAAMDQYELAEKAYGNAEDYSPLYSLIFQSQIQQRKMHAYQKKYNTALSELSDMLNDTKNTEYFSTIHFEIAKVLELQGKTAEAIEKYRYIDTAFARTDEAAKSYFAIAQYHESIEVNYDSARTAYNKARMEFPASDINKEAGFKADIFNKYLALSQDLIKFDSLRKTVLFIESQIDSGITMFHDSLSLKKDTLAFVRDDGKIKKMTKPGKQEIKKDTVLNIDSTKIKELFIRKVAQVNLIDSLQRSIVRTKFDLAGLFYLELQNADSALFWFDNIVRNYPQSEFSPRALYTIAEIYRGDKLKEKAVLDSLYYRIIVHYPTSPYANEARKNVGIQIVIPEKDTVLELFEKAEVFADSKKYSQAIALYNHLIEQYPTSYLASKILFTAGWHYENTLLNTDSAIAFYRRLLKKFPLSQYAVSVQPKITEYDNEKKRIEAENLQKLEEQKLKMDQEKQQKESLEKKSVLSPADSLSTPKNMP